MSAAFYGVATFVGPLIVAVFLATIGAGGVTVIFASLYVAAGFDPSATDSGPAAM